MPERVSRVQRMSSQIVAEREVQRFRGHHALWHKHVHNVDLDPAQILKMEEMDRFANTVDFSARRTGKTAVKELYLLEFMACNADQELGIVAPREAQSLVNLNYHLEAIRRSPILSAFIDYRAGRPQSADTYYRFANRSTARGYGIMAQVDGSDLTAASLEEVDDMPRDRLYSRFLLTMGATRRLGASDESKNDPQIRVTGVFKGADTLSELVKSGTYHLLPTVDVHLGIELGILNERFMQQMRDELDPDEYIRQLLCKNIASRNLVWQSKVREAMTLALRAGIELAEPMPGERYRPLGPIAFGYDAGGHGENPQASRHCLVVIELVGSFVCVRYVKFWAAGADDMVVKRDLASLWRYFRPDYALGDAYGVGMLTALNDDLFREGLTEIDRRAIGDGDSTATTWPQWAFSPLRFEGMTKHQMAMAVRQAFHGGHVCLPYLDDHDLREQPDLRALVRQIPNIVPVPTKTSYPSYRMADSKIGDDGFDALMAAMWALATRGQAAEPTVILTADRSRAALLSPAA